jgi:hypothetical protein
MVEQLRRCEIDYAFSDWQTMGVVIVGPSSPFTVTPTPYAIADVHKAAAAGLLQKRDINCCSHFSSFNRDVYVVKQP